MMPISESNEGSVDQAVIRKKECLFKMNSCLHFHILVQLFI